MRDSSRREFLKWTATVPAAAAISGQACLGYAKDGAATPSHMQLGLVTYNWGRQWDLPTVIRNCEDSFFNNRSRPCLQYQIRRCTAPCVNLIDEAQYRKDIDAAILFLEGRNRNVVDHFVARMEAASKALDYELAARFRERRLVVRCAACLSRRSRRVLARRVRLARPGSGDERTHPLSHRRVGIADPLHP